MVLIESLGTMVWTTNTRVITSSYSNAHLTIGGAALASVSLIAGALALALVTAFWAFLRYTLTGRAIRAMGQDRRQPARSASTWAGCRPSCSGSA